jgi:hypothetical protein
MCLKFLLQFLQQAASGFGTEPTVAAVNDGASLANGSSSNGCWKMLKSEVDCYEMVMII